MSSFFDFGPFRLDARERTLRRDGVAVNLTPKSFDLLLLLLAHRHTLVEKNRILSAVWGDVHVDESVLTRGISDLRKALGQTDAQVWIETVPKFGYRFVGEVRATAKSESRKRPPWVIAAVLAATLITAGLLWRLPGWTLASSANGIHRLAILPFRVLGESPDKEVLGAGLADALITRLSNLEGLIVRPMSSVRRFEGASVDPIQAARELEADAVLEGTLESVDGSVRAYVRLIRASDGKALLSETLDAREPRLLFLQDSLAQQVAQILAIHLSDRERRDLALRTEANPDSHRLYVKGRYELGKRNREAFERAADYFRQAIDLDPSYARALAGLADCYLLLGLYGYRPPLEMLPEAKTTALRALQLDPRLPEAHATLGLITQNLEWDWTEVERQYREASRLAPNYSTAHHWYAEFLSILGRFDESRNEFARARQIDPISPIVQTDEAQLYFFSRQYDRNLELLEKVSRENPSFALVRERMAYTYMVQNREDDAWREVQTLPECAGEAAPCRQIWTAWLPRRDPAAASEALRQLEASAAKQYIPLSALVVANARQGNVDRALDWLESMESRHDVWLITAKVNPIFDPLRPHPRMRAMLTRLHLD